MTRFILLLTLMLQCCLSWSQIAIKSDTMAKPPDSIQIFAEDPEILPEFPGGISAFCKYVEKNLRYPDVAQLIGINGKVRVQFVVGKNGKVTNATPTNCLGAGCESEALMVIKNSPAWKPGTMAGRPIPIKYSVPISFSTPKKNTALQALRNSNYGFVFDIKGLLYTINEAEKILGKSFKSTRIISAEPFFNYEKDPKFDIPGKKEIYLIIMK